jgi:replication factor C subunit 3/5
MALWVDKYRPTQLNKLDYHKEQAEQLKKIASFYDIICQNVTLNTGN